MRRLAIILLAVTVAGCGSTKPHKAAEQSAAQSATHAIVLEPAGRTGHWQRLVLSPDGRTFLGQWIGECEARQAFFIPASGGKPLPVTDNTTDESVALGWTARNRARVLFPRGLCGSTFQKPGVYLVDPRGGKPVFIKPA